MFESQKLKLFPCRIFEATNLFFQENVESIYLPSKNGDCEIFVGHQPIIQVLKTGIVKCQASKGNTFYAFVFDGIFVMDGQIASIFTSKSIFLPDENEETLAHALHHFSYQLPTTII